MNPFEPPLERPVRSRAEPLRIRLVALGMVAVGLWHVSFAVGELNGVEWVQLGFGFVCFGLAVPMWKPSERLASLSPSPRK